MCDTLWTHCGFRVSCCEYLIEVVGSLFSEGFSSQIKRLQCLTVFTDYVSVLGDGGLGGRWAALENSLEPGMGFLVKTGETGRDLCAISQMVMRANACGHQSTTLLLENLILMSYFLVRCCN